MTCKDCIHYEVCLEEAKSKNESLNDFDSEGIEVFCRFSKPKSRYIELPCAVGDTVWALFAHIILELNVVRIAIEPIKEIGISFYCSGGYVFDLRHIGKDIFLTKEEAEKALERSEEK